MAFAHETLLLLLLSFSTFCFPSTAKQQRLVTKLIHRNSVLHPHYNQNGTTKERMELDIQHSNARAAFLSARIEGSLVSGDYRTNISPSRSGGTILANLSVGQPPIPQLVVVDTGSSVLWVMCKPCSNCALWSGALFDPSKSSTYTPLCRQPCGFSGCKCHIMDQEPFNTTYADGSFASGTLGQDMLVFETSDEGTSQLPNIAFGCAHRVGYYSDPGYNGILGLNNGLRSLASQIGQKFSYCIGNLSDKNYNYNQLILGEGADLEGYSTTFVLFKDMHYVTLEGISIGERRLDIAPETFDLQENGTGGVILDTGTELTYLVDKAYNKLYKEVQNLIGWSLRRVRYTNYPQLLCYWGTVRKDLAGFPVVTFHFAEDADLALDTGSFFFVMEPEVSFCMAVAPTSAIGTLESSIIGLWAQQSYNVGYDLVDQFIYFQRIDCALLSG